MLVSLSRIIIIPLLLVACSAPPVISRQSGLRQLPEDDSLISYYQWLSVADVESLRNARQASRLAEDASPEERLRHALLLSFDDNASTDDLRTASTLMTEVLEEHPELPRRHVGLALLWNNMLNLRLELLETMARQADTIDSLQQRNAELMREVDAIDSLRERNKELERQIEALTVIEQQLNERERQEPES